MDWLGKRKSWIWGIEAMAKSILPLKTPISYYGGKQRIADHICKIIHQIPHTVYSEPFCGGLAVLYQKGVYAVGNDDHYREAINDTNKQLITFWRVAREQPQELERWIDLTPYSQEEHRRAREIYNTSEQFSDLEIAWAVFIQCNASFANKLGHGWASQTISRNSAATWHSRKAMLPRCFERLSQVHIGCEDALDFIKRWDSSQTLHYCDPPYPSTELGHYKGYTLLCGDFGYFHESVEFLLGRSVWTHEFINAKALVEEAFGRKDSPSFQEIVDLIPLLKRKTIYQESQIKGAYDNARLLGFPKPTREQAIAFLDWYFAHATRCSSVAEAMRQGLLGLATNGIRQQESYWQNVFGVEPIYPQ